MHQRSEQPASESGSREASRRDTRKDRWLSGKSVLSGAFKTIPVMPQRFIDCDRDQVFLMPPSLLEWVASDHLVWTVLGLGRRARLVGVLCGVSAGWQVPAGV